MTYKEAVLWLADRGITCDPYCFDGGDAWEVMHKYSEYNEERMQRILEEIQNKILRRRIKEYLV